MNNVSNSDGHVYWIASYPRSGNTLARIAISRALLPSTAQDDIEFNFPSVDIEQSIAVQNSRDSISEFIKKPLEPQMGWRFATGTGITRFVKTHWRSPVDMMTRYPSVGAVYLIRHPLDVFLSGLNYMFWNSRTDITFRQYFIDANPRPVEEIVSRGEIDHYLDDFLWNCGFWPFQFGCGTWVENVKEWVSASKSMNILVMNYTFLVSNRSDALKHISNHACVAMTPDQIKQGVKGSEDATRPDGAFFWRGGNDIIRRLPPALIRNFEKNIGERLPTGDFYRLFLGGRFTIAG